MFIMSMIYICDSTESKMSFSKDPLYRFSQLANEAHSDRLATYFCHMGHGKIAL